MPWLAAPSKTSIVLFGSALPATVTVLLVVVDPFSGLVSSGAAGATVSTVQERLAGLGSVLPAPSVARTWKLCAPWARPL